MDNDIMASLMGVLNDPETKAKLMNMISPPAQESFIQKESYPPPAPSYERPPAADTGMDIVFKMKNIADRLNRNDDYRIGLLNSIKPFMKNGREKSIDTAINFIRIINLATGR